MKTRLIKLELSSLKEKIKNKIKNDFGVNLIHEFTGFVLDEKLNTITVNESLNEYYLMLEYDYKSDRVVLFEYEDYEIKHNSNKISDEKIIKLASEFILTQLGDIYKDVKLERLYKIEEDCMCFFQPLKDGIVIFDVSVVVTINPNISKITGYSFNDIDISGFEKADDIISKDIAKDKLTENITIGMSYSRRFSEKNQLVYYICDYKINAHTGDVLNEYGLKIDYENFSFKEISDDVKTEIAKSSYALTSIDNKEMASEKAKEIVIGITNKCIAITDVNLSDDTNNGVYYCEFEDYNIHGSVSISKSGELINFGINCQKEGSVSQDKAYEMALDILSKYYSDKIMQIKSKVNSNPDKHHGYCFVFSRQYEGIEFEKNYILISISKSGYVSTVRIEWDQNIEDIDFEKVISEDRAKQIFLDNHDIRLEYIADDKGMAKSYYSFIPKTNRLFGAIDAVTGAILNY